jgi:hypothetical protein
VRASEIAIAPPPHGLAPIQFELVINLTTANRELLQDGGAQHLPSGRRLNRSRAAAPSAFSWLAHKGEHIAVGCHAGERLSVAPTSKYVRDFKGVDHCSLAAAELAPPHGLPLRPRIPLLDGRRSATGRGSTPRSPGGLPTRWRHPGGHHPPALARADRAALMPFRARAQDRRRTFYGIEELGCIPEPLPSPAQVPKSLVPFVLDVVSTHR